MISVCSVNQICRRPRSRQTGLPRFPANAAHAGGDLIKGAAMDNHKHRTCSVSGCGKKHSAKGLCGVHYARLFRYGSLELKGKFGSNNTKWRGGITRDSSGRVMILMPEHPFSNGWGYVYRYRSVVEQSIGRFLKPSELVHHVNGDKTDDRIENLVLTNRSDHQKIHKHTRDKKGRFTHHENSDI
jgi:hypothetical protein